MVVVNIYGTNVTLTESTYNKYQQYEKCLENLKVAQTTYATALHSYLYDEDGCDKSDLFDYQSDVDTCEYECHKAWEAFVA